MSAKLIVPQSDKFEAPANSNNNVFALAARRQMNPQNSDKACAHIIHRRTHTIISECGSERAREQEQNFISPIHINLRPPSLNKQTLEPLAQAAIIHNTQSQTSISPPVRNEQFKTTRLIIALAEMQIKLKRSR
jgi:hypothetical protein